MNSELDLNKFMIEIYGNSFSKRFTEFLTGLYSQVILQIDFEYFAEVLKPLKIGYR